MNYAVASAQTYCTGVKLLEQLHYVVRFIKSLRRRVSQRPGCKRQRFFAIFSLLTLFVPSLLLPLRATLSSSFTGRLTKAHVAARSKEDWEAEPATVVARLVFEMCCSAHSIYTKWIRSYWQPISQWCTHANSIWHPCASNCFFTLWRTSVLLLARMDRNRFVKHVDDKRQGAGPTRSASASLGSIAVRKHTKWRLSYLFAHLHLLSSDSFFLIFSLLIFLFSLPLPYSAFHLSILPDV